MKRIMAIVLCMTFLSATFLPYASAAEQVWQAELEDKMAWSDVTDFGTLLVGSNVSLASYHPESGDKLWIREDLKKLAPFDVREMPGYPILVTAQDKGLGGSKSIVEAIRMGTGETLWKTEAISGVPLGIYPVTGKPVALFFINETMNTEKAGIYIHAYNIETGELLWKSLYTPKPGGVPLHLADNSGMFYVRTDLSGYQDPVVEGDVAYVTFAGLQAIDLKNGSILWDIPFKPAHKTYKKAYAAPIIDDSMIYATGGGVIYAVDKTTGTIKWQSAKIRSGLITQLVMSPEMLVARIGGNFYNPGSKKIELDKPLVVMALNKADGAVLWEYKGAKGGLTNLIFLPQLKSVLFCDAKNLIAIDTTATGTVKEAFNLPLKFKRSIGGADVTSAGVKALTGGIGGMLQAGAKLAVGKEREDPPIAIIPQPNATVVVRGEQHILAFDPGKQEIVWSATFNSPGASALGIALVAAVSTFSVVMSQAQHAAGQTSMNTASDRVTSEFKRMDKYLDKRFSKTKSGERYAFILTHVEAGADKGIGIAAIDLQTGDTNDQFILGDKDPEYVVDEPAGRVYYFKGKKKILAFDMESHSY